MKTYAPLENPEPVLAILEKISFLGGVSDFQRAEIFRWLEVAHYREGEYIARRGEAASHLYIITKGRVELHLEDDEGELKKREFQVGDCFGEAALLSLVNETASFIAAENCELIVLSRRALNQLRGEDPAVFSVLMVNLARELARKLQFSDRILLQQHHPHPV